MNDDKTWLIEAGDVLEVMTPDRKPTQPAPRPRAEVKIGNIPPAPASQRPALAATGVPIRPLTAVATPGEPAPRRKKPAPPAKGKLQFAPLALLTYVLGPLALFLTPRGRRQKGWVAVAGLAVGATALLAGLGFDGIVDASRPATVWAWLGLVVLAVAGGFTAWARALHLIGAEGIPSVNKLPWWVRRAWTVSGLGLVAPGSGLLMSGRAGRAALVLWGAWPVVAAAVLLRNGLSLWRHHETAGWLADHGVLLERGLIAVAAVVALGFLGYVAQALEGVRQVMVEPGLKTRVKGDYYAVAVMAFALALVVVANPAQLARQIDTGGHILREEGFRAIPLELSLLSARLDPARVEYALQAMDLYSELGAHEQADAMRAQLDANLGRYVALVQREAVSEFGLARAEPTRTRPARAAAVETPVQVRTEPTRTVETAAPAVEVTAAPPAEPVVEKIEPLPVGLNATWYLGAMMKGARGSAPDSSAPGK